MLYNIKFHLWKAISKSYLYFFFSFFPPSVIIQFVQNGYRVQSIGISLRTRHDLEEFKMGGKLFRKNNFLGFFTICD